MNFPYKELHNKSNKYQKSQIVKTHKQQNRIEEEEEQLKKVSVELNSVIVRGKLYKTGVQKQKNKSQCTHLLHQASNYTQHDCRQTPSET